MENKIINNNLLPKDYVNVTYVYKVFDYFNKGYNYNVILDLNKFKFFVKKKEEIKCSVEYGISTKAIKHYFELTKIKI